MIKKMTTIPLPEKRGFYTSELSDVKWIKCNILRPILSVGVGSESTFEVYTTVINNIVYMKPTDKIYPCYEYEQLFDFGIGSHKYDKNKIIFIPSDTNYYINLK
tara:strand:- start:472 stop:783 length:312 start_codon:yes stop_codon:yes gene_type:complete